MRWLQHLLICGVLSDISLCAHAQVNNERQILLLKLAASGSEPVSVPASDDPIYLSYRALASTQSPLPGRIYVRVFRGTKNYLIKTMPLFFKKGCVNYSSALLEVSDGGQLSFRGMNIEWLSSNKPEHFTLVFEAADPNPTGNSSLRLSNDHASIADYFNSGIEIQLLPPTGFTPPVRISSPSSSVTTIHPNAVPVYLPPCHVITEYRAALTRSKPEQLASGLASMKLNEAPCGL